MQKIKFLSTPSAFLLIMLNATRVRNGEVTDRFINEIGFQGKAIVKDDLIEVNTLACLKQEVTSITIKYLTDGEFKAEPLKEDECFIMLHVHPGSSTEPSGVDIENINKFGIVPVVSLIFPGNAIDTYDLNGFCEKLAILGVSCQDYSIGKYIKIDYTKVKSVSSRLFSEASKNIGLENKSTSFLVNTLRPVGELTIDETDKTFILKEDELGEKLLIEKSAITTEIQANLERLSAKQLLNVVVEVDVPDLKEAANILEVNIDHLNEEDPLYKKDLLNLLTIKYFNTYVQTRETTSNFYSRY